MFVEDTYNLSILMNFILYEGTQPNKVLLVGSS